MVQGNNQTGFTSQQQSQARPPKTQQTHKNRLDSTQNSGTNFKSLDNMSNISASAFSVTAPKVPPIPPLQLKTKKSQGSGQLNTTDEYYKLHKQKIMEQRRTNSQMQL